MANMTIANPGIGNFFSGLAKVLSGNDAATMIQADVARTNRDNVLSETAINKSKLQTLQRQENAMQSLADILGDPTLASTPEGRAHLMSVLSQVPDGLKEGPGFALGSSTFTNPNVFGPDELSNAAFGTGVAPNYANTPSGLAQTLSGEMDRAVLKERGDTLRKQIDVASPNGSSGGAPMDVSLTEGDALSARLAEILTERYPNMNIDPAFKQQLEAGVAQLYQQTRNAPGALSGIFDQFDIKATPDDANGWTWDNSSNVTGTRRAPVAGTPLLPPQTVVPPEVAAATNTPVLPNAQPPAAPASPNGDGDVGADTDADGEVAPTVPGAIPPAQLPPLARGVTKTPDGRWAIVVNGQTVPLENGQTMYSPSTGMRLMFRDGAWVQVQ